MKTYILFLFFAYGSIITLISCSDIVHPEEPDSLRPPDHIDEQVYNPNENPFGKTYTDWIDEWIETFPGNSCDNAGSDHNGSYAMLDKSERVYFLAGSTGRFIARSITILPGKAILFPVANMVKTFPCSLNPAIGPASQQPTAEFLKDEAAPFLHTSVSLRVTLDALPYRHTEKHKFISNVFKVTNGMALKNCFEACITMDSRQDAVCGGYWIMLKELEPGEHILTFKAEVPEYGLLSDVSYNIIAR